MNASSENNSFESGDPSLAPNAKYCPQCQRLCALTAQNCRDCGHRFRTKFRVPAPKRERPDFRARLQNFQLSARRWMNAHQAQWQAAQGPLGWSAIVLVGILLLVHPFGVTSNSRSSGVAPVQADAPKAALTPTPRASGPLKNAQNVRQPKKASRKK